MRQRLEQLVGDTARSTGPDVDHLVVALAAGDESARVLTVDFVDRLLRLHDDLIFFLRHDDVVDADGESALCGIAEAGFLELIQEFGRAQVAHLLEGVGDDLHEPFLVQELVVEADFLRDDLIEEHAAGGCFQELAFHAHFDAGVQADLAVVVGDDHFVGGGEDQSLTHVAGA